MPIIKEQVVACYFVIITKDFTSCYKDKLTTCPTQIAQFRFFQNEAFLPQRAL